MISNLQFLTDVTMASIVEYIGDASFKLYARLSYSPYLLLGIIAYIGLVAYLIKILKYANVMQMNLQWDAISALIETILAYILLGETLTGIGQYIGFFFIITGLMLMNFSGIGYK